MCKDHKFFRCKHCGNLVGMIDNKGVKIICCGEPMTELVPNTVEASAEKHLPIISVEGNTVNVKVGAAPHPMLEEHHIEWIYLLTEKGGQRKCFKAGLEPELNFAITEDDKAVAAFSYCNLHGLWLTQIEK